MGGACRRFSVGTGCRGLWRGHSLRKIAAQSSLSNLNAKDIVAADHNGVMTGYEWEHHNRLHIGATSWFIFARLSFNLYYYK